jgi:hypothetical protein
LGDGDKGIGKVYDEEKFCIGATRAAKAKQKSLVPARQAKRTNQEFVLFESSFTSVSTVSRDHPSLVSLV